MPPASGASACRRISRSSASTTPISRAIVSPALTTVRQPLEEMGRMAVSLLTRLLDKQKVETLPVELGDPPRPAGTRLRHYAPLR